MRNGWAWKTEFYIHFQGAYSKNVDCKQYIEYDTIDHLLNV